MVFTSSIVSRKHSVNLPCAVRRRSCGYAPLTHVWGGSLTLCHAVGCTALTYSALGLLPNRLFFLVKGPLVSLSCCSLFARTGTSFAVASPLLLLGGFP